MWRILLIVGLVLLVIFLLILVFYIINKNKSSSKQIQEYPLILKAIGDKENITSLSKKGTRISIQLKDKNKLNKTQLKECGINTIVVSNLKLTMALNANICESVYTYLYKIINNK